jgi:hypothetical protein
MIIPRINESTETPNMSGRFLLQPVVLLYGEGIVVGCEHLLDELRRVRSCTLANQQ